MSDHPTGIVEAVGTATATASAAASGYALRETADEYPLEWMVKGDVATYEGRSCRLIDLRHALERGEVRALVIDLNTSAHAKLRKRFWNGNEGARALVEGWATAPDKAGRDVAGTVMLDKASLRAFLMPRGPLSKTDNNWRLREGEKVSDWLRSERADREARRRIEAKGGRVGSGILHKTLAAMAEEEGHPRQPESVKKLLSTSRTPKRGTKGTH